jgi:hypothetical protein
MGCSPVGSGSRAESPLGERSRPDRVRFARDRGDSAGAPALLADEPHAVTSVHRTVSVDPHETSTRPGSKLIQILRISRPFCLTSRGLQLDCAFVSASTHYHD